MRRIIYFMRKNMLVKFQQLLVVTLVLISMLVLACGCSSQQSGEVTENAGNEKPLQLFVAAGMKKPMDVVIEKFQAEKGVKVVPNYASSGGLWAQIREGQPCDLYFSADWMYIEMAQEEDMITNAEKFLSDCLVLVVSDSGIGKIKTMEAPACLAGLPWFFDLFFIYFPRPRHIHPGLLDCVNARKIRFNIQQGTTVQGVQTVYLELATIHFQQFSNA